MSLTTFLFANLILLSSAKVFPQNSQDGYLDHVPAWMKINLTNLDEHNNEDKLWVLDLNDEGLDTLMLREGTEEEVEDFNFYDAPLIEEYLKGKSTVVKKDAAKPIKSEFNDKIVDMVKPVSKEDIFKYLNKFALYSKQEADTFLTDSIETDDPSIALYFKGQFTSLMVKVGIKEWNYLITPAASRLPSWFYGYHSNAQPDTVVLPKEVKEKFYPALFHLLQIVLKYPV